MAKINVIGFTKMDFTTNDGKNVKGLKLYYLEELPSNPYNAGSKGVDVFLMEGNYQGSPCLGFSEVEWGRSSSGKAFIKQFVFGK